MHRPLTAPTTPLSLTLTSPAICRLSCSNVQHRFTELFCKPSRSGTSLFIGLGVEAPSNNHLVLSTKHSFELGTKLLQESATELIQDIERFALVQNDLGDLLAQLDINHPEHFESRGLSRLNLSLLTTEMVITKISARHFETAQRITVGLHNPNNDAACVFLASDVIDLGLYLIQFSALQVTTLQAHETLTHLIQHLWQTPLPHSDDE